MVIRIPFIYVNDMGNLLYYNILYYVPFSLFFISCNQRLMKKNYGKQGAINLICENLFLDSINNQLISSDIAA